MKKILITGGSGFIGTNLISELLLSDENVILNIDTNAPRIISHKIYWQKIDIRDRVHLSKCISDYNPDIVIHLAARTDLNGRSVAEYDSNTTGVSNLIEILNELHDLKLVLFTSSMYVCRPGYIPKDYNDYAPHTFYGQSKVIGEKLIKSSKINFNWTIIRPTSIWGPWFGEPYLDFFKIVLSNRYFHFGSICCNKTYGYIDNTIYQIISLLNSSSKKIHANVYYLGDWPAYNISEWAEEIAAYCSINIVRIPYIFARLAAYLGDFLKIVNIKFPLTSFRLINMKTDNIHDLRPIKEVAPNLPVLRRDGTKYTIKWINNLPK